MTSLCDDELLGKYVRDNSQAAFAEIVSRHLNLVYSAALRQLNGDHARAADVSQIVFAALARKSPKLLGHPTLVGWLYRATQLAASEELRHSAQRQIKAQLFAAKESDPPSIADVLPSLDAWLGELRSSDRQVLLLRFFEGYSYPRLASSIGVRDDAARMRVERALQRLREKVRKKGIISTTEAIAALLAEQGAIAAPELVPQIVLKSSVSASQRIGTVGGIAAGAGLSLGTFAVVVSLVVISAATGLAWYYLRVQDDRAAPGVQVRPLQVQNGSPSSLRRGSLQTDDVAPRVHVDVQDLPPNAPTDASVPHALRVNGEPYASEIATTMAWRNPLGLTSDQKEIVQAAYQTMRRKETSLEASWPR